MYLTCSLLAWQPMTTYEVPCLSEKVAGVPWFPNKGHSFANAGIDEGPVRPQCCRRVAAGVEGLFVLLVANLQGWKFSESINTLMAVGSGMRGTHQNVGASDDSAGTIARSRSLSIVSWYFFLCRPCSWPKGGYVQCLRIRILRSISDFIMGFYTR